MLLFPLHRTYDITAEDWYKNDYPEEEEPSSDSDSSFTDDEVNERMRGFNINDDDDDEDHFHDSSDYEDVMYQEHYARMVGRGYWLWTIITGHSAVSKANFPDFAHSYDLYDHHEQAPLHLHTFPSIVFFGNYSELMFSFSMFSTHVMCSIPENDILFLS